uniref:UBX domain protein 2A n=1 Tax=Bos taurus TaxID=9913 RepID=A0AAA9TMR9_BOVIN
PREARAVPAARPPSSVGPGGGCAPPLRGSSPAAAATAAPERTETEAARRRRGAAPSSGRTGRVCETGSDHQPLSDSQQKNCEYFVDSLFEEAQKVGAKCLSPTEQKKQVDVSIKLWKNGFTVNDDFRSYSDGASQQFLNSIKKGELPLELQGVFDKEEVDVKVEDKKNEVCMSTKPVFQPFSGQGHRLGSATPKIVSKAKNIEVENKNKLSAVPLNNLEPITNIQIWLANGKRIVQKFNISHRQQPTRLPRPWDSPGKNTGVGCHFLLQCMKVKSESEVTQSCPTPSDPMDCSLPGSSVHGIF